VRVANAVKTAETTPAMASLEARRAALAALMASRSTETATIPVDATASISLVTL
jgi:hypothetical protein